MTRCIVNLGAVRGAVVHITHLEPSIERKFVTYVSSSGFGLSEVSDLLHHHTTDPHVLRAMAAGEKTYRFSPSWDEHICITTLWDWLTGLEDRDARLFAALTRMSFADMLEHSDRWHESLKRKAEKLRAHGIERDDVGAPVAIELDGEFAGWRWVWLKSDAARDDESTVMGHCIGGGGYDKLPPHQGVFSLRDQKNAPHATLHVDPWAGSDWCRQAVSRGNSRVPDRYKHIVERATDELGVRLLLANDPLSMTPAVGCNVVKRDWEYIRLEQQIERRPAPTTRSDFYTAAGATGLGPTISRDWRIEHLDHQGHLHREDGPALIMRDSEHWHTHGVYHRVGGPALIIYHTDGKPKRQEWYVRGQPLPSCRRCHGIAGNADCPDCAGEGHLPENWQTLPHALWQVAAQLAAIADLEGATVDRVQWLEFNRGLHFRNVILGAPWHWLSGGRSQVKDPVRRKPKLKRKLQAKLRKAERRSVVENIPHWQRLNVQHRTRLSR